MKNNDKKSVGANVKSAGPNNKSKAIILKLAILLVFSILVLVSAYWMPFRLIKAIDGGKTADNTFYLSRLIFYSATSLPLFALLVIGWTITDKIKQGAEFTLPTAKKFAMASKMLFCDAAVFLIGQIVLSLVKWTQFDIMFFAIGILGLIAAMICYFAADYVKMASEIKEENDGIV